MKIWVDGDSVPRDIRSILLRRAGRGAPGGEAGVSGGGGAPRPELCFVCSKRLPTLPADLCVFVQPGPGSVDGYIVSNSSPGDIAVTRDIPLAESLTLRGVVAISDRGEVHSTDAVAQRRSERDANLRLRNMGILPPSPRSGTRGRRETKSFADALDRTLAKLLRDANIR